MLAADAVGTRRLLRDKKQLEDLKYRMGESEWNKLSSAKQRKKQRKLANRQIKATKLEQKLLIEANLEERKLLPTLQDKGKLGIAMDQRFDEQTLGRGLQLSEGGLIVRRNAGVQAPTFVFWGNPSTSQPISRWCIRIDRQSGSLYIGMATVPLDPEECYAKYLQSSAVILGDSGKVYRTETGTPRSPARKRFIPTRADGTHKVDIEIPLIGTRTYVAKNKYRTHKFSLKGGVTVLMEYNRNQNTLQLSVDRKQYITIDEVPRGSRPFLNFFAPGDGATILSAEDGPSIN
mmetsp:Transcript_47382/g.74057  ORF Transcript_47382/g.74057 Transcript_47382/m.74057 type:complete len:290 (-) Transcript_47382:267-1136(-)